MKRLAAAKKKEAEKFVSRWGGMSTRVKLNVHKELAATAAIDSPFDTNRWLFAFTNTVFDLKERKEVGIRKYDMVLLGSQRAYTEPTAAALRKVHNLVVSILPPGPRRTLLSMLRRGLTADRVNTSSC